MKGVRVAPGSPSEAIGLLRGFVLFTAAIVALQLAVDGRHRDFLTLPYLPAALAFALIASRGHVPRSRAVAWLSALLALCGVLAIDHPADGEAWAWAATCLLLAAPGWPAIRQEALRVLGSRRGEQE